jgi:hypothetical protein
MFLLDSLLIGGLRFVFDKVATVADQEMFSPEALQRRLLEAQMQLEEGVITDAEFEEVERDVLARLRELKGAQTGLADAGSLDAVEVDVSMRATDGDDGT